MNKTLHLNKKKHFNEEGYVIIPNLISKKKIDRLLSRYEKFKNNNCFFYSQSHHNWNRTKECMDEYGNLTFSIENFTDLIFSQGLSKQGRNILQSREILNWLQILGDNDKYTMHGNMFFDKSTATADHLDTWYIDTNPRGKLIAVWIALEKICFHQETSGHLYITKTLVTFLNHNLLWVEFLIFYGTYNMKENAK